MFVNGDRAWVTAVADGLGGHPFGDDAAQASVDALPGPIASVGEKTAAFDAANAAAWTLHPAMRSRDGGLSSVIALTTLVVAACTSEGGLLVPWIGDSMAFAVPIGGGGGWHSTPHGDPFGFVSRCIGMLRTDPDGFELPPDRRGSAGDAADTLTDTARLAGLLDNTTTAVARITAEPAAGGTTRRQIDPAPLGG